MMSGKEPLAICKLSAEEARACLYPGKLSGCAMQTVGQENYFDWNVALFA